MRPHEGHERLHDNTVLGNNGMVKIAPSNKDEIMKCMFSIENLAWKDSKLKPEQIGKHGGRIMWFPPYGLKFTENVQPQWEGHSFIGRGEKIYTYVNTERSGTLNFTLLVDHPSIVNKWRRGLGYGDIQDKYEREQDILRFFAGCGDLDIKEEAIKEEKKDDKPKQNYTVNAVEEKEPITYKVLIFFPNNFSGFDTLIDGNTPLDVISALYNKYEVKPTGAISNGGDYWNPDDDLPKYDPYQYDTFSYMLNKSEGLNKYNATIKQKLGIGENDKLYSLSDLFENEVFSNGNITNLLLDYDLKLIARGYASSHGYTKSNNELGIRRASIIGQWAKNEFNCETEIKSNQIVDVDKGDASENRSALGAKIGRSAMLTFEFTPKTNAKPNNNIETTAYTATSNIKVSNNIKESAVKTSSTTEDINSDNIDYYKEYEYFKELESNDNLIYTQLVDKIKYFNPAFHSITPEGFNARLTFLHQCTRQGPTNAASDDNNMSKYGAGNLAFGRAPYCILRIGDFYYTKIMIDSLTINYDTNQWDLNPEGIGVQPMLAEISINFKFVGGSDIAGPIEKLQNAVSSNYYANTSIYDDIADRYLTESEKQEYNKNSQQLLNRSNETIRAANEKVIETVKNFGKSYMDDTLKSLSFYNKNTNLYK